MAKLDTPAMERINRKRRTRSGQLKQSTPLSDAWKRLKKNKPALVGGTIVIIMLLIAIFAPVLAPYTAEEQDYTAIL